MDRQQFDEIMLEEKVPTRDIRDKCWAEFNTYARKSLTGPGGKQPDEPEAPAVARFLARRALNSYFRTNGIPTHVHTGSSDIKVTVSGHETVVKPGGILP